MVLGKLFSLHVLSSLIFKTPVILPSHVTLSPLKEDTADFCRALQTFGCAVLWHNQGPTVPCCGSDCEGERSNTSSMEADSHRGVPGSQHQIQESELRALYWEGNQQVQMRCQYRGEGNTVNQK